MHARMKEVYIARHDTAVRLLYQTLQRGHLGGCYSVVDAGNEAAPIYGACAKRLPTWMTGLPREQSNLYRPDILIAEGLLPADTQQFEHGPDAGTLGEWKSRVKLHIFEVGYTSELDEAYNGALQRKQEQHQALCERLRAEGWELADDSHAVVLLGTTGIIYKGLSRAVLKSGVGLPACERLSNALHLMAVRKVTVAVMRHKQLCDEHRKGQGGGISRIAVI